MSSTKNQASKAETPAGIGMALRRLAKEPFYWLLLTVPVAVGLELFHAGPLWLFIVSGLAVIPLASPMKMLCRGALMAAAQWGMGSSRLVRRSA